MAGINMPVLSEYDPATSAEGALDPLGLYAIADSLAVELCPGLRERMSHPRYLTLMALGSVINRGFEEGTLAADGQSEPYLVFEWHAVEGLVRSRGDDPKLKELPGKRKASDCIRDHIPLSSARYLKTASVFGFHGVYRGLADNLDVLKDGQMGDTGYALLTAWEREQGLKGLISGQPGVGFGWRNRIASAIGDSLAKGSVARGAGWQCWGFFGDYLFPNEVPPEESRVISHALMAEPDSHRAQVLQFLITPPAQDIIEATGSERDFHHALRQHVNEDTARLLDTIIVFERFSRLIQDAFDDCRFAMTQKRDSISLSQLALEKGCVLAHEEVPRLYQELSDRLEPYGQSARFVDSFHELAQITGIVEWVEVLLQHHRKVQRNKPPNGKNPWFMQLDKGNCVVRGEYRRKEPAHHDDSYVNYYRTFPLNSFVHDLQLLEI